MDDFAISARGLGKRYRRLLRSQRHDSLRDVIAAGVKDMFASKSAREERTKRNTFWALSDAEFDIKTGENVGIIGLNGAGKSTLLKLLSRITTPTTGNIRIRGRLGALLEVGTGFHAELTGRENVFLYGSILGMTRKEVAAKFDQIVEFAEIAEFIDTPVKRYSSGMYVRLAFAVAAHLDPDILLLDEVLAVGDFAFQRKCMNFAKQLQRRGATILFVSHNMFSIKTMCQRVIYLKKGQVVFDGPTAEGLRLYEADSRLADVPWFVEPEGGRRITFDDVQLLKLNGEESTVFDFGERMKLRLSYKTKGRVERVDVRVGIDRDDDTHCMTFSSMADGAPLQHLEGDGVIELITPPLKLTSALYTCNLIARDADGHMLAGQIGGRFHLSHPEFAGNIWGVFHESAEWRIAPSAQTEPELQEAVNDRGR
jgi:lipopolysaccharide transport system ATP-binding protein